MLVTEQKTINGIPVNYTYSDSGKPIRCGKIRYKNVADALNITHHYFEEGGDPESEPTEEAEDNGD